MKFGRMLSPLFFVAFISSGNAEELVTDLDAATLIPLKETPLGLYMSCLLYTSPSPRDRG